MNENENRMYPNLQDVAQAVLRRKFKVVNIYIKKERSQVNNISFHLRSQIKKTKPAKASKEKNQKVRVALSELDNRKTIEINKKKPNMVL